ncbi:MAG TPA: LysR substrate-binding domain-containing protein [Gammaproteobacteria bacterium]
MGAERHVPFRALRRAFLVHEVRHLTRAANALDRSQSAITRSVLDLERFLGCRLFERRATGMVGTRHADLLFRRVQASLEHLAAADRKLRALTGATGLARRTPHILQLDVSNAVVLAVLAVFDHRDVARAAASLGIAPKSVRKSITAVERQLGTRLFERTPTGAVAPTEAGNVLATHLKRALSELRAGLEELRGADEGISGVIRVGVTPSAGALLVPRAVRLLRRSHPNVVVAVRAGADHDLLSSLRSGDLDLVVGTLDAEDETSEQTATTRLTKDHVEVVARADHPLARGKELSLADLLSLEWALPPRGSPLRRWFSRLLESEGLPEPRPLVETASLTILRGALLESECVGLTTQLECWHELVAQNLLEPLTIPSLARQRVERPLYLNALREAAAFSSPAVDAFLAALVDVAANVGRRPLTSAQRRYTNPIV